MKRVLLSLWAVGGALYAVSTLAPDPKFPPVKQEPAPEVASNAAEGGSSHAILPEQPAAQARAVDQPPAPGSQLPQKKLLKLRSVASLHIGPSNSAKVIGTAQADTEAEVVSRDSGWVQIVDPLSGRSGWIDAALVAPSAEGFVAASAEGHAATGTPPSQQVAEEALPKPSKKTQKKAKPVAQAPSTRPKQRSVARAEYGASRSGSLPRWDPYNFSRPRGFFKLPLRLNSFN